MENVSLQAALKNRMGYLTARQGVISGNIANVNTPKFKAQELQFEKIMARQSTATQATTHAKHLTGGSGGHSGHTTLESTINPKHNGNTVHIDEQMIKLNETQLQYRLATSLYSKHAAMQRMALGAGAGR